MTVNLTCTQVSALLSFYIEDKLSCQLRQFVEMHLEKCPTCRAKLDALSGMMQSLKEVHEKIAAIKSNENTSSASQSDELKINISAYVDNELNDEDNIRVKKCIISNPQARKELESMYNLKKILTTSFEKSKNESKEDYSKYILRRIDIQEEVNNDSFARIVAIFGVIIVLFTLTAMIIFWV